MEEEQQQRQVKGIWIPIEIWKDKNLTWNEKILFLEIDSYTSQDKDCFFSNQYISELLGISETNANKTLSSLIQKGYVIKTKFDGRKRYVKSALSYSTTLPCQERQPSHACANNNYFTTSNESLINKDNKEEKELKEKSQDEEAFVEKIYKLYPTKCPVRKTSLGKSYKDKDRIRKLMKTYSMENIERVVKAEIEEKYGKHYMQNFSTFLNNFPDPSSLFGEDSSEDALLQKAYESLTLSEEAEIYGIENKEWFYELTESQLNYWRKEYRNVMLKYISEHNG